MPSVLAYGFGLRACMRSTFQEMLQNGIHRNSPIPEFVKLARFWNIFGRFWSQNQDLGLKLIRVALTRRDASIGAPPGYQNPCKRRKRASAIFFFGPPYFPPIYRGYRCRCGVAARQVTLVRRRSFSNA